MTDVALEASAVTQRNLLVIMVSSLALIGFLMVASASMDVAAKQFDNAFYFIKRHGIYLLAALVIGAAFYTISMRFWRRIGAVLLGLAYLLLILVLLPGVGNTVNGSTRWISLGLFTVQVSEIVKVCVLIYLAGYLVRRSDEVQDSFWGFVKPILVLSLLVVLLLMQPDFGAVVVIMTAVFAMLFLGGVKFSQFSLVILVSGLAGYLLIATSEYRMRRVSAFFDPFGDQFSSGYQLVQSLIAFGRGDILGVGLGNSIQKLFYLPEAHTDFVFSIIAEELGMLGALGVLGLFMGLVLLILSIGRRAESLGLRFNGYLAYGVGVMLGIQALINIGVCTGLLPTKGLTLPFVSYGGSSLIINTLIVAIVLRIAKENYWVASGSMSLADEDAPKRTRKNKNTSKSSDKPVQRWFTWGRS